MRAGLIHVPEGRRVFPNLSVRDNLLLGAWLRGRPTGRGLMAQPRLLILDEPSLGLSPLLTEAVFALIQRLHSQGMSILLVEQNAVQSLAIAQRAYVVEHARIALSGAAEALAQDPRLRAAYLGL